MVVLEGCLGEVWEVGGLEERGAGRMRWVVVLLF